MPVVPGVVVGETMLPLKLTVAEKQKQLEVTWDRNAGSVTNAQRGVLTITDGGNPGVYWIAKSGVGQPFQQRGRFVHVSPPAIRRHWVVAGFARMWATHLAFWRTWETIISSHGRGDQIGMTIPKMSSLLVEALFPVISVNASAKARAPVWL